MVFQINLITSFNYSDTDDKNFDFFVLHVAFMLGRCEIRSSLVIGSARRQVRHCNLHPVALKLFFICVNMRDIYS